MSYPRPVRWTALIGIVVVGCGTERVEDTPERVTGCDDPAVWSATPLEEAKLTAVVGGIPCNPSQYPLHQVELGWFSDRFVATEEMLHLDRTCWRVVDASEGSGWSAGAEVSATGVYVRAPVLLQGSGARMTVEGRVLRDDGTVAIGIPPEVVALRDVLLLDDDAADTLAVMSPTAWAARDAVYVGGQRIASDEVLGAGSFSVSSELSYPVTLHRTTDGIVWRRWPLDGDDGPPVDVNLGPGTRARIVQSAYAVVIDDELVVIDPYLATPQVRHRIPLAAEPDEVVGTFASVTMHIGDALVRYEYHSMTPKTLAVGDGVLLPGMDLGPAFYFDGTTFHALDEGDVFDLDDNGMTFTPEPADLAQIGAPAAVLDRVVFGERGLLAIVDGEVHGPRVATFAHLFGGGTLGAVSTNGAAYVIRRDDGSAELYGAFISGGCPI